jgi:RNA-directed DNA polymerase
MTQSMIETRPGLIRIREAAKRKPELQFNNLFHHLDVELLGEAYRHLKRNAAPGVDGVDWAGYGEELEKNLEVLVRRLHTQCYRTQAVLRQWIPKANGQKRPIGITTVEDKVVQQGVVWLLEAIYEREFLGFSYGFRSGRSQHDALDAVYMAVTTRKVSWVLDADIKGFFDAIEQDWLMEMLKERIADKRLLRLIERMLKSGVQDEGKWNKTEVGTPQGAVISPMLGNIYLRYVLDLWAHQWRKRKARGEVYIVRYADDSVLGFQYRSDGERFLEAFKGRLAKFGLSLNEEKTRLIEFGRFADGNRRERGAGKPEVFEFLGFTHLCSKRRSDGGYKLLRQINSKRQRSKLRLIKETLMRTRHRHPYKVGAWLKRVVQGYYNYFAVPDNHKSLSAFRREVCRAWLKALRRRSQKGEGMSWEKAKKLIKRFIPSTRVLHPYPSERFGV